VEIRHAAAERYPAPVETAAYLLVTEALDDAARRGASHAEVHTVWDDDRLVVTVEDDGWIGTLHCSAG
jgi:signal transduction histidine kinase